MGESRSSAVRLAALLVASTSFLLPAILLTERIDRYGLSFAVPVFANSFLGWLDLAAVFTLLLLALALSWGAVRFLFPRWRKRSTLSVCLQTSESEAWVEEFLRRAERCGFRVVESGVVRWVLEARRPVCQTVEVSLAPKGAGLRGALSHQFRGWVLADAGEGTYADQILSHLAGRRSPAPDGPFSESPLLMSVVLAGAAAALTLTRGIAGPVILNGATLVGAFAVYVSLLSLFVSQGWRLTGWGRPIAWMTLAAGMVSLGAMSGGPPSPWPFGLVDKWVEQGRDWAERDWRDGRPGWRAGFLAYMGVGVSRPPTAHVDEAFGLPVRSAFG